MTETGIELYTRRRRAGVAHWRALTEAELTEPQLRRALRRDLPLALDLLTMWGTRRRQPNAQLLYFIAAQVLGPKQRAHLADLVEHWRRP